MQTPNVTEFPRHLEPVAYDTFLGGGPSRAALWRANRLRVQGAHRRATGWDAVSPLESSGIRSIRIVQPAGVLEVEYRITIPLINA